MTVAVELQRGLSATYHPGSQVWVPVVETVSGATADGTNKRQVTHWRRAVVQVQSQGRLGHVACCLDLGRRSSYKFQCVSPWHAASSAVGLHQVLKTPSVPATDLQLPPHNCPLPPAQGVHKQPSGEPLLDVVTEDEQEMAGLPAGSCCLQVCCKLRTARPEM
jgi:hypothetical protein